MAKVVMVRSRFPDVRLQREARTLLKAGHDVTIIAWDRKRGLRTEPDDASKKRLLELRAPPSSIQVIAFLPLWFLFCLRRLLSERHDIIHAADLDGYLPALIVARLRGSKLVYDIYDFYAETMKFPVLRGPMRRLTRGLDLRLAHKADLIILPDESRTVQLGPGFEGRTIFVYNAPEDDSECAPAEPKKGGNFRLFYGGEVSKDRCIAEVIRVVRSLPDVELKIIGPADAVYAKEITDAAAGCDRIRLELFWHDPADILRGEKGADALFAIYDPAIPNNRFASPNKLFEAMMCSKAIVVNEGTSMASVVKAIGCGIVIPGIDEDSIRRAIIQLRDDRELRNGLGANGRAAYEKKYSWKMMGKTLTEGYERVVR